MWYLLRLLSQVIMAFGLICRHILIVCGNWNLQRQPIRARLPCPAVASVILPTPATEMVRNGYRYTSTLHQIGSYSSTRQYYAARVSDWGYVLRYWGDATGCGWWEDTTSAGGGVASYASDYDGVVQITFDTAILWATIKKITE